MSRGRRVGGELCVVPMMPVSTEGQWPAPYSPNETGTSMPLQQLYAPLPMAPAFGTSAHHLYPTLLPYPPPQGSFFPGPYPSSGYGHPGIAYQPMPGPPVGGWHPHAAYAMHMQQQQQQGAYFAQPQPGSPEARQQRQAQQQQQWQRSHVSLPQQQRQQPRTPPQQRRQAQQQQQPQRRQQQLQQHQRRSSAGHDSTHSSDAFVLISPYAEPPCTPGDAATAGDIHVTSSSNVVCSSDGSCGDAAEVPKRQLTAMIKGAQTVRQLQSLLDMHGSRADYIHICAMAAKLPKLQGAQPRGHEAAAAGSLLDQLLVCLVPRLADCSPRELANVLWACGKMAVIQGITLHQLSPECDQSPPVLCQLLGRLLEQLPAAKAQELSNVLWALAKLSDSNAVVMPEALPSQLEALLGRLVEVVASAKPQECSNALWALAKVAEGRDGALPRALERQLQALLGQLVAYVEGAKCQEVINALWAAAKLTDADHLTTAWPSLPRHLHVLLSSLRAQLPGAKPQELCNALCALGRLRAVGLLQQSAVPEGLVEQLVIQLGDTEGGKHPELANALWASAQLRLPVPESSSATTVMSPVSPAVAAAVAAAASPAMQHALEKLLGRYAAHIDVANAADVAAVMWAVAVQGVVKPLQPAADGGQEPGSTVLLPFDRLVRRFMHSQLSATAKAADVAHALTALALVGSSNAAAGGGSGSSSHWQLGRQLPADVERCFERLVAVVSDAAPAAAAAAAVAAAAAAARAAAAAMKPQHLAMALHAAAYVAAANSSWAPSGRFAANVDKLLAGSLGAAADCEADGKLLREAMDMLVQHMPALQQQQQQQQQEEEQGEEGQMQQGAAAAAAAAAAELSQLRV